MKTDLLNLVTPKQNAEIVKMVSEGLISSKQAKELLTIVIEENIKEIVNKLDERRSGRVGADCKSVA